MKTRFWTVLLTLVLLVTVLVIPASAEDSTFTMAIDGYQNYDEANQVLEYVNTYRKQVGAAPLKMEPLLMELAMQRAAEVATFYSHTRPDNSHCGTVYEGTIFEGKSWGENIAIHYKTAKEVSTAWYNSPGHYQNMVNNNYTSIGIACFYQEDGVRCWVQLFSDVTTPSVHNKTGVTPINNIPITASTSIVSPRFSPVDEKNTIQLYEGQQQKIQLKSVNKGFDYKSTAFSDNFLLTSSNTDIVTVEGTSLIAKCKGKATITANIGTLKISATVQVNPKATVSCTTNSFGQTIVSWNTVTDHTGLYYKINNGSWSLAGTRGSVNFGHLQERDTYYFVLRNMDGNNTTDISDVVIIGDYTIAAPKVTTTNVTSSGKNQISWKKVDYAVKYDIYYSTKSTGTYQLLHSTADTSYVHSAAKTGTRYYYKVQAVGLDGTSSKYSSVVGCTCDLARPSVTVSNTASTGRVKLSWKAVSGATGYEIYRSTSSSSGFKKLTTVKTTSYTDTSATATKTYYYRVKAICGVSAATSAYSVADKATADLPRPNVTASNIAATGKVKLSWKTVAGATGYEIYRSTSSSSGFKKLTSVKGTSYTDTSAAAGKTYYYRVKATCGVAAATSAYSAADKATTDLPRPNVTVSNVAATGKVKLSWKTVAGATGYEIYRSTSSSSGFKKLTSVKGTSYTDTSAAAGKTYYYRVKAICSVAAATSAYSAADRITVDLARPDVSISLKSGKPQLSWGKVSGATGYEIYRSTNSSSGFKKIKTVKTTSYTDTSVTVGKTYYYQVKSICNVSAAASASSSVDEITLNLAKPKVSITLKSGKPQLSWNEVSGATRYVIYRSTSKNGTYSRIYTTTRTSYRNISAQKGVTYYYKVYAACSVSAATSAYDMVYIKATK